jgi:hypothetical protein
LTSSDSSRNAAAAAVRMIAIRSLQYS